jgi:hypothetical protein
VKQNSDQADLRKRGAKLGELRARLEAVPRRSMKSAPGRLLARGERFLRIGTRPPIEDAVAARRHLRVTDYKEPSPKTAAMIRPRGPANLELGWKPSLSVPLAPPRHARLQSIGRQRAQWDRRITQ